MSMEIYKKGQGYWTRLMSTAAGGLMALLGAYWLGGALWSESARYWATGAGVAFFAVCCWLMWRLFATSQWSVDFLVATEAEMKKINWSTRREVVGSTIVVVATSLGIAFICWAFDLAFYFLFVLMKVLDPPTTS